MWTIQWMDNEPHEIMNTEQLNHLLDELEADHNEDNPILVQIQSPNGEILMIGIGGELSVLNHIATGGWPAQHSVGNEMEDTIPYRMGSYDSEMPKSDAIPQELARKTVNHFYKTGQLLEDVTWEND
jgi:hypothetical protein